MLKAELLRKWSRTELLSHNNNNNNNLSLVQVDGCDAPRFQPYNIRGWFWASTLQGMGDTNVFRGRKVSKKNPRLCMYILHGHCTICWNVRFFGPKFGTLVYEIELR